MPAQSDWTRVKDPTTGHEYSTLVVLEGLDVIDKPAADTYGQPYPPKHNRPLSSIVGPSGKSVDKMTADELADYANANGVTVDGEKPVKADILGAIVAVEGDEQTPTASAGGNPAS